MTVSLEDAVGLLRKWATEATPVSGILAFDGVGASFRGFIADLVPHAFVVSQFFDSEQNGTEVIVGLKLAQSIEYQDLREASDDVRERPWREDRGGLDD